MTDAVMSLRALAETCADVLREMIGFAAQRPMELEVAGPTSAANPERLAQRNGLPRIRSGGTATANGRGGLAPSRRASRQYALTAAGCRSRAQRGE